MQRGEENKKRADVPHEQDVGDAPDADLFQPPISAHHSLNVVYSTCCLGAWVRQEAKTCAHFGQAGKRSGSLARTQ